MNQDDPKFSRRNVITAMAAAAGLVAVPALMGGDDAEAKAKGKADGPASSGRMPVVFLPHGGGPWPFVEMGLARGDIDKLAAYTRSIASLPKTPPKALLVVSAHWEEAIPTVMTSPHPPMLYDYYGFPPASYEITWPSPGAPHLTGRIRELLGQAGFQTATDASRGFDHGTFIPLKLTYPKADIPTLQLSLVRSLDPEEHVRMGRALAPLRDEGILIVGSGMSFHNLRMFGKPNGRAISEAFDAWLREVAVLPSEERERRLIAWEKAPEARLAHPREEHLLPLMVAAGAALEDPGTIAFSDVFMGARITAVHYG